MLFITGSPMRITRVVLVGYKRLLLSSIHHLDWSPVASYQMILGTNGCGKSSLMAETSPLPANSGDFIKGGSKQVELVHDHVTYLLTSTIGSTTRHSFIRDGHELNDGGTVTIQKELVETHLRYTEELHKLLTGRTRFTDMSVAQRRYWITRLSRADYRYAIKLYDKLKSAANDMGGAIKVLKARLGEETVALQRTTDQGDLEGRVTDLQRNLTQLLYARSPTTLRVDVASEHLHESVTLLERIGSSLKRSAAPLNTQARLRGVSALEPRVQELTNAISVHDSVLERLRKEYDDVQGLIQAMDAAHIGDATNMVDVQATLMRRAQEAQHAIVDFPGLLEATDPIAILQTTEEIFGQVIALFAQLPDNSNRRYSRDTLQQALDAKRQAQGEIDHGEAVIKTLKQRLHAIEHAQGITCPECRFQWVPGVSMREGAEVKLKIDGFQSQAERHHATIHEASRFLEEAESYMALYRQWRGFVNQYPRMHLLWDYLQAQRCDVDRPGEHQGVFHRWLTEVQHAVTAHDAKLELIRVEQLLKANANGQGLHLRQRLSDLERDIAERTRLRQRLKADAGTYSVQLQLTRGFDQEVQRWHDAVNGLEHAYDMALAAVANDCIDRDITATQGQLGALQHTLNAKQVLLGVIDELKGTLHRTEQSGEVLSLLAKELSPKEGLIAEQLYGFIQCLVAQLNSILSSVWTYDLEIEPCGMEKGELDYQFPMMCGSPGPRPSDISEGSASQKDIINFAFVQTVMLYENLVDYPMFTDELGNTFDEAHRPSINAFIARLMESQRYSQVFMISHYVAGWGAFNDAEYLVLDPRNIAVPSNHNTHATLS